LKSAKNKSEEKGNRRVSDKEYCKSGLGGDGRISHKESKRESKKDRVMSKR